MISTTHESLFIIDDEIMKEWNLIMEYYDDGIITEEDYSKDETYNKISLHDKDLPISSLVNVKRI